MFSALYERDTTTDNFHRLIGTFPVKPSALPSINPTIDFLSAQFLIAHRNTNQHARLYFPDPSTRIHTHDLAALAPGYMVRPMVVATTTLGHLEVAAIATVQENP